MVQARTHESFLDLGLLKTLSSNLSSSSIGIIYLVQRRKGILEMLLAVHAHIHHVNGTTSGLIPSLEECKNLLYS
jgi:hypothetical protein